MNDYNPIGLRKNTAKRAAKRTGYRNACYTHCT